MAYCGPEVPFPELDRVFDTVVKRSCRRDDIVYVMDEILSAFPTPYLEHYERLTGVQVKKRSEKPERWWERET